MRLVAWLGFSFGVAAAFVACSEPARDLLVKPFDAGVDADAPYDFTEAGDPELGKPCTDDKQCDDTIPCTFDTCDPKVLRCRNHPDSTLCDDGVFCNGKEICFQRTGCAAGPVITCDEGGGACVIDRCVEATKSCAHAARDADEDGDPDAHCMGGADCNDANPAISSLHSEVCANGDDDNCNGQIDEMPCVAAQNATCATALSITGPGNYLMDTHGAPKTFDTTCSVSTPMAAHDVVAIVTVPSGPNVDLDLWVTSGDPGEVSVAVQGACGMSASEIACGAGAGATQTRTRARDVSPGKYAVIVTSQDETTVALQVDFLTPTPKPTNETCATAAPLTPGVATTVSIIDPATNLATECTIGTGELVYSFTLATAADVSVYASTLKGSGRPVVSLRDAGCALPADEIACHAGSTIPLFARLGAGTYTLAVSATTPIDESVLVATSPPTSPPADQSCSTAPALTLGASRTFDLSGHEESIHDGCLPGNPTAAYAFDLSSASDVLLVARYPVTDTGAVSLTTPACTLASRLTCYAGETPARTGKRDVAAGSYRAVVSDTNAQAGTLSVFARATAPSVAVTGGDDCTAPWTMDATGGFYTGDTSTMKADFDESCDTSSAPPFGAPDQVLRLDLAKTQHVVLSMEGSTYNTILSVRTGSSCPGTELVSGCTAGFSGPRSFLDFPSLAAGTYWIIVDGYASAKGGWDLDAYVVDP